MENVADWVGRKVRIGPEGIDGTEGEIGIVLAVDDTAYRPAAWLRVQEGLDPPSYRSVDLCWVVDIETGADGPYWGAGGPEAANAEAKARRERTMSA